MLTFIFFSNRKVKLTLLKLHQIDQYDIKAVVLPGCQSVSIVMQGSQTVSVLMPGRRTVDACNALCVALYSVLGKIGEKLCDIFIY